MINYLFVILTKAYLIQSTKDGTVHELKNDIDRGLKALIAY